MYALLEFDRAVLARHADEAESEGPLVERVLYPAVPSPRRTT